MAEQAVAPQQEQTNTTDQGNVLHAEDRFANRGRQQQEQRRQATFLVEPGQVVAESFNRQEYTPINTEEEQRQSEARRLQRMLDENPTDPLRGLRRRTEMALPPDTNRRIEGLTHPDVVPFRPGSQEVRQAARGTEVAHNLQLLAEGRVGDMTLESRNRIQLAMETSLNTRDAFAALDAYQRWQVARTMLETPQAVQHMHEAMVAAMTIDQETQQKLDQLTGAMQEKKSEAEKKAAERDKAEAVVATTTTELTHDKKRAADLQDPKSELAKRHKDLEERDRIGTDRADVTLCLKRLKDSSGLNLDDAAILVIRQRVQEKQGKEPPEKLVGNEEMTVATLMRAEGNIQELAQLRADTDPAGPLQVRIRQLEVKLQKQEARASARNYELAQIESDFGRLARDRAQITEVIVQQMEASFVEGMNQYIDENIESRLQIYMEEEETRQEQARLQDADRVKKLMYDRYILVEPTRKGHVKIEVQRAELNSDFVQLMTFGPEGIAQEFLLAQFDDPDDLASESAEERTLRLAERARLEKQLEDPAFKKQMEQLVAQNIISYKQRIGELNRDELALLADSNNGWGPDALRGAIAADEQLSAQINRITGTADGANGYDKLRKIYGDKNLFDLLGALIAGMAVGIAGAGFEGASSIAQTVAQQRAA